MFVVCQLKEAMDKTFADRRQLIVKRKIGLAALKRVYPALFNEVEVSSGNGSSVSEGRSSDVCYLFIKWFEGSMAIVRAMALLVVKYYIFFKNVSSGKDFDAEVE